MLRVGAKDPDFFQQYVRAVNVTKTGVRPNFNIVEPTSVVHYCWNRNLESRLYTEKA